jgi:antitoxin component YwqK of YwqJK toxin-antitoxin module
MILYKLGYTKIHDKEHLVCVTLKVDSKYIDLNRDTIVNKKYASYHCENSQVVKIEDYSGNVFNNVTFYDDNIKLNDIITENLTNCYINKNVCLYSKYDFEISYNNIIHKYYDENGYLYSITTYVNSKKNGLYKRLNNNKLIKLCYYKDNILHGLYKYWNDKGNLIKNCYYKDGKLNGLYQEWNTELSVDNQNDTYENIYENLKNNIVKKYDINNIFVYKKCYYENDILNGYYEDCYYKTYYNSFVYVIKKCYYKNGKLNGLYEKWEIDNSINPSIFYKDYFNIISSKIYPLKKCYYKNNKLYGNCIRYYDLTNMLFIIDYYKNDKKNGKCIRYWDNGNIKHIENYRNNKLNGYKYEFYKNGIIQILSFYKNDNLEGMSKSWNEDGTIYNICNYKNNMLNGHCISYDDKNIFLYNIKNNKIFYIPSIVEFEYYQDGLSIYSEDNCIEYYKKDSLDFSDRSASRSDRRSEIGTNSNKVKEFYEGSKGRSCESLDKEENTYLRCKYDNLYRLNGKYRYYKYQDNKLVYFLKCFYKNGIKVGICKEFKEGKIYKYFFKENKKIIDQII